MVMEENSALKQEYLAGLRLEQKIDDIAVEILNLKDKGSDACKFLDNQEMKTFKFLIDGCWDNLAHISDIVRHKRRAIANGLSKKRGEW